MCNAVYRSVINDNPCGIANLRYSDLLNHFLAGLLRYVDPSQVEITYFPPINDDHIKQLRSKGIKVTKKPRHPLTYIVKYAFQLYMYEDIPEILMINDVDTWVLRDPTIMVENTRAYAGRADPCSYRNPKTTNIIDWKKYREALSIIGFKHTWKPPAICNGNMVFRGKDKTKEYYDRTVKYLHMLHEGEIPLFMPKRYMLFMASMLSVVMTYPRKDIWFWSREEMAFQRTEQYAVARCMMMGRRRLK